MESLTRWRRKPGYTTLRQILRVLFSKNRIENDHLEGSLFYQGNVCCIVFVFMEPMLDQFKAWQDIEGA